jgi:zinc transport system substrate-binding protein
MLSPRNMNYLVKLAQKIVIAPCRSLKLVAIGSLLLGLASCTAPNSTPSSSDSVATDLSREDTITELQVVTTILPITQFTKAVVGDRAEVINLLPTNVSPHDYQASPADVLKLAEADVLVQNGLEIEAFLEDVVANAENPDLVVIDASAGIVPIASEAIEKTDVGHEESEHEHDHEHESEKAEHDDHEHDDHAHGEYNPHVWLDPKRAIEQVENIRDGLIAADPAGAAAYTANASAYIEQLQALDTAIAVQLAPYAGKTFVAYHDFAPYFAASYDLEAEFLVNVPEANPSPQDVKNVIDVVAASNLKTLLTEPQVGEEAFAALAQDLNVQVSVFDPIETGTAAALAPDYYLTIMRQNAANLEAAFGGATLSGSSGAAGSELSAIGMTSGFDLFGFQRIGFQGIGLVGVLH